VEKCGRVRQAADGNIIQRMRLACWITKATDAQSEYAIFFLWHGNNGYANALQCYVYSILLVVFLLSPFN